MRPRSSEKYAWLLSAPSTVLLFSRTLMPRKLSRPKPSPLETTPGVSSAKLDQRLPLMGRLSMAFWSMVVEMALVLGMHQRGLVGDLDVC